MRNIGWMSRSDHGLSLHGLLSSIRLHLMRGMRLEGEVIGWGLMGSRLGLNRGIPWHVRSSLAHHPQFLVDRSTAVVGVRLGGQEIGHSPLRLLQGIGNEIHNIRFEMTGNG